MNPLRGRLSFTTMATPDLDHKGALEFAKRYGYSGVDLRCSDKKGEVLPGAPAHAVEGGVPLENMLAFIDEVKSQPGAP